MLTFCLSGYFSLLGRSFLIAQLANKHHLKSRTRSDNSVFHPFAFLLHSVLVYIMICQDIKCTLLLVFILHCISHNWKFPYSGNICVFCFIIYFKYLEQPLKQHSVHMGGIEIWMETKIIILVPQWRNSWSIVRIK